MADGRRGKQMKRESAWMWFQTLLVVLTMGLYLWAALGPQEAVLGWYSSDDAFYYYKIARNINAGLGVTFDGINRTNGFHPLWMLVCVGVFWLARIDLFLPLRVLMLVSAAFSLGAGLLLFRLLRKYVPTEAAAFAAVLWAFLPSIQAIVVQGGMEASASAFFLMLLFYLGVKWHTKESIRHWAVLGLVAGLAILARLDNIFVVMLFGVWFSLGSVTPYLRTIAIGDLALIFIFGLLSYYFRFDNRFEYLQNSASLPYLIGSAFLLKPLIFWGVGLYRPAAPKISWRVVWRTLLASTLASAVLAAFLFGFQALGMYRALPRTVILIDWGMTTAGIFLLRWLAAKAWPLKDTILIHAWETWKAVIRQALGYYLPALGMLISYMAWNHFYIGSAMPVSGQIKRWWGGLNTIYGRPVRDLSNLLGVDAWPLCSGPVEWLRKTLESWLAADVAYLLTALITVIGAAALLWLIFVYRAQIVSIADEVGAIAIFAGLYAQIFSYTSTLYMHRRPWYWSGELLFTVLWIGLLTGLLFTRLKSRAGLAAGRVTLAVLSLACIILLGGVFQNLRTSPDIHRESRRMLAEVEFLETHTSPGSLIGITGGGTVAYFIRERSIVNLDGLVNSPEYFELMRKNRGAELLDKIGLDYVYGRDYKLLNSAPYQTMFAGRLRLLDQLSDVRFLYQYIPSGN